MGQTLKKLWQRGCDFLGTETAIMGGAMSWVSERNLVAAISNAGGFGMIACGAMSPALLKEEIQGTQALTNKPFGVNLITMHPEISELIDVCISCNVGHIALAGGVPTADMIKKIKAANIKVICFAPALSLAKRLIKLGADALVVEGHEAGGHIGPVSTSVLVQEILPHVTEVPVFVAGGIGRGDAIGVYLRMGAAGCQLGTRFVCATESKAHANFKQAFIKANARNAVVSTQLDGRFPVIPVRALANQATKDFMNLQQEIIIKVNKGELEQKAAQLKIEHFWAGALRRAVIEGDIETGSLMAGQSVGMVTSEQPTQEIINELVAQASTYLER